MASGNGFQSEKVDDVPVSAGTIYTLQLKLAVAQTTATVEVSANQLGLDTTTATLSTVLPTIAVQDVPSNGRDYTQLVAQSPGYAGYNSLGGGGYASVNGTRPTSINWQLEGTDNNDIFWNLSAANLSGASGIATTLIPTEAIDEFSFVASSGPELGRNAGGTVNLVIKSGTNQFHGSGFTTIETNFLLPILRSRQPEQKSLISAISTPAPRLADPSSKTRPSSSRRTSTRASGLPMSPVPQNRRRPIRQQRKACSLSTVYL